MLSYEDLIVHSFLAILKRLPDPHEREEWNQKCIEKSFKGNTALRYELENILKQTTEYQELKRKTNATATSSSSSSSPTLSRRPEQLPNGVFFIRSVSSGLYLDAKGMYQHEGTEVIIYSLKDEETNGNQKWSIEPGIEGKIIRNLHNGLVLTHGKEGEQIKCCKYVGNPEQEWMWEPSAKAIVSVASCSSSNKPLILDVQGAKFWSTTPVICWTYNGGKNQKWEIIVA